MKTIYYAIIFAVVVILSLTIYNKCTPDYILDDVDSVTTIDSVTVDSLTKRIEYLESLPPVIVRDTLKIPVPVIQPDSSVTYHFPYRDSLLTARWTLNSLSEIEFTQVEFEYFLRRQRKVIKETETVVFTEYRTTTVTKKFVEKPKPYFTFGFEAGNINTISPTLGFTTKKKYHIRYRYDPSLNSHNVGISIPIKF